ncbi:hypothetical protein M2126_002269, partial [Polynucleobacter sphagniphilus]|nr:hypothetical protein [Polynucleobacter sphagniphilus]MDH6513602.1 hypothetical protein [Polynucleobacter sphagniphilus]
KPIWSQSIGDVIGKGVNHVVGTGRKACVRYVPLLFWWAHPDLSLGPKDL